MTVPRLQTSFPMAAGLLISLLLLPGVAAAQKTGAGDGAGDGHNKAAMEEATDGGSSEEDGFETVVTANRRKSSLRNAAAMVTVIPREELQQAPERTVDSFLRRVPSVSFSRQHVAECGPGRDITLRGIQDQKRTLILVDGVPINDGVTGAVNWSLVPKEAVERLEVVRGPMSALYGSGAMGGVINIITRKPSRPNETLIQGSYGSLNTASATVMQGGRGDHVGYLVAGNILRSDGYIQAKDPKAHHTENARTDLSLMGRLMLHPDDRSSVVLGVSHVNESYSRGLRFDDQNNATTLINLGVDRHTDSGANITLALYSQIMSRKVDLGARPKYDAHDHTEYDDMIKLGQLFQTDFRVADFNTITVGIDSSYTLFDRHNDYALTDRKARASGNQLLASLFAQDELRFAWGDHRLHVTPGVRVDLSLSHEGHASDTKPGAYPAVDNDYPDRSWVAANPKLGLVYRYADWTTVRASAGRSFAAPTLFEMYTVFTRGPLLLNGNPELDPESAWSAEVGIDQRIVNGLLARLTGWYTRGQDFIGYRTLAKFQYKADNITEVQIAGLDAELRYDITPMWAVYGGYTLSHSTILEDDSDATLEGNTLPFVPRHRARLGVQFRFRQWVAVDLSARYEGERFTDTANTGDTAIGEHLLLDLAVSGKLLGYLRWGVSLQNILDQRYDIYSVPTEASEAPGILASGTLGVAF